MVAASCTAKSCLHPAAQTANSVPGPGLVAAASGAEKSFKSLFDTPLAGATGPGPGTVVAGVGLLDKNLCRAACHHWSRPWHGDAAAGDDGDTVAVVASLAVGRERLIAAPRATTTSHAPFFPAAHNPFSSHP